MTDILEFIATYQRACLAFASLGVGVAIVLIADSQTFDK